ncbi:MAG: hypothetical protein WBD36_16330 [Bacteroidota bacterium]
MELVRTASAYPGVLTGRSVRELRLYALVCLLFFVLGLSIPKLSIALFLALAFTLKGEKQILDRDTVQLILFLALWNAIALLRGEQTLDFKFFAQGIFLFVVAYAAGFHFPFKKLPAWPMNALVVFVAFSLGLLAFSALSLNTLFQEGDIEQVILNRSVRNYWIDDPNSDSYTMGVAMVGMFTNLVIGLLPMVLYRKLMEWDRKQMRNLGALLAVAGTLAIMLDVILSNRTPFILLAVELGGVVFYLSKTDKIGTILKPLIVFGVIGSGAFAYLIATSGIVELLAGLMTRFGEGGLGSVRYDMWLYGLSNALSYPFGGLTVPPEFGLTSFHNLWLDVVRLGGILPLFPLVAFQVRHVKYFRDAIRNLALPKSLRVAILCIGIAIAFAYMGEPLIQGPPVYFAFTFFFLGVVRRLSSATANAAEASPVDAGS